MLNREVKKRIDDIHDLLVGKLPLPSERLELITISLIYKFMDDMDERSIKIGGGRGYFKGGLLKHSWRKVAAYKPKSQENAADQLVTNFNKAIKAISEAPDIPEFFQSIFRNSSVTLKDGRILKAFMDAISEFEYSNSEELGNAYEYMLLTFGNQKDIGAFRTPRHIIDFIVEVVQPHKSDKILDPACGTSGFLISAWNYIRRSNTTTQNLDNPDHWGDTLSNEENTLLASHIQGYDNTPLMVRLSKVNMFLHKIKDPQINEYDTISSEKRWNEKFDCILANPPFMTPKGGVKPHNKFKIKARKSELLFCDYIMEHLKPGGKAGFIVPEGIITNSSNNHFVEFRKWAVNEMGLWAVVSLPSGVFQPYAGVKTSILFFDRSIARTGKSIILLKIENDGHSLNTARLVIKGSDIPAATDVLLKFKHILFQEQNNLSINSDNDFTKTKFPFSIVPREDFAKLDPYRSTSTAWSVCRKELKNLEKAFSIFNDAVKTTSWQISRQFELLYKACESFTLHTGYTLPEIKKIKISSKQGKKQMIVPLDEVQLKSYFETELKEQAVYFGNLSPILEVNNGFKLPHPIEIALDKEREYNLSIDIRNILASAESIVDKVSLGELLKIEYGKSLKKGIRSEGEYPVYGSNGVIGYHKEYYVSSPFIVIGRKGSAGSVCYSTQNGWPIDTAFYIKQEKEDRILTRFAYYLLDSLDLMNYNNSVGVPGINRNDLNKILIPVLPLKMQDSIVSELDSYQKIIDGCNLVIDNYLPFLNVKDDWEKVQIGEIADVVRGSSPRPKGDSKYFGGNIPRLMVADITRDGLYTTPQIDFLTEKGATLSRPMKKGDVVITVSGNPGLPTILACDACIHDGFVGLRKLNTKVLIPEFLYFYLLRIKDLNNSNAVGAIFLNLTTDYIKDINIPIPDLSTQREILADLLDEYRTVEGCRSLKTKMESKIKQIVSNLWNKE